MPDLRRLETGGLRLERVLIAQKVARGGWFGMRKRVVWDC
jgi:hypothetical protein